MKLTTPTLKTVLISLGGFLACECMGGEFRTQLPTLEGIYGYGGFKGPAIVDLGTRLQSVSNVVVRLSGLHTNGWWVGDGVEDWYVGPVGAHVVVLMDSTTPSFQWGQQLELTNDGSFSVTVSFHKTTWDFVGDGITDLWLESDLLIGFGGFTLPPFLEVTNVLLTIEATPEVIVKPLTSDGTLTWSTLPSDGIAEIESAGSPEGPWQRERLLTNNLCSIQMEIREDTRSRFFRVKWTAGPQP